MQIEAKFKDEEGNIVVEGRFSPPEISFLLQFAVNHLMSAGVAFLTNEEKEIQMQFPHGQAKETLN
jgi:hypothetical protein